jgi:molybdenum cofactor synthesis domain-containing protein
MKENTTHTITVGIIIIGNEILSGKVHDENSFYLASELRGMGVDVRRISVIPDEIKVIGSYATEFSRSFNYVFTTGGVGPTHDDVTMEGVARGFGVPLVQHSEIKKLLVERFGSAPHGAVLKMAEVPEGSEVVFHEDMRFPVVSFKNIFIFPGIPEYVKNKFPLIKEKFVSSPFYLKRIFLNSHESEIAEVLTAVVNESPDVGIGSYPVVSNPDYRIVVTVESKSRVSMQKAYDRLMGRLAKKTVVRTD